MTDETCCGACGYPIHATKDKACDWCRQSADRIEALTAENKRLGQQCEGLMQAGMNNGQALIIAEAKLAAAVDWFETIRDRAKGDYMAHTYYLDALAALATIKRREP
jgi:hypothetical protein